MNCANLIALLTQRERKLAVALTFSTLVAAIVDAVGVASILPFTAVLSNPEVIHTNAILNEAFIRSGYLGVHTEKDFLFVLGLLVFSMLVFSLFVKALVVYAQTRFLAYREYSIGKRLFQNWIRQPYSWFLEQHSADLGKDILSEVSVVVGNGMTALIVLISQAFLTITIVLMLLIIEFEVALTAGATLGGFYVLVFVITTKWLKQLRSMRLAANSKRFLTVSEAFGAAKQVKVSGTEQLYTKRFSSAAKDFAHAQGTARLIGQMPRFTLEMIAFGGILILLLHLLATNENFVQILPMISLYIFAGYRLMPAVQQIYQSTTQLRFVAPAAESLLKKLRESESNDLNETSLSHIPIRLTKAISLTKLTYRYPKDVKPVLKDLDITISAGSNIGIVGATGSGKTTLVDLILGLLEPTKGELRVDDLPISSSNVRHWQQTIGYVPQAIFIVDDSVTANIAFGIDKNDVDEKRVQEVARVVGLHDFILNELSDGYATKLGERGVRLSGGQLQRIGIARGLYHKPQVLVLDEATSALDNVTERRIMDAISKLDRDTTVLMVAHRLSTIRHCDQIFLLDNGQVIGHGRYDELLSSNQKFAEMVGSGSVVT